MKRGLKNIASSESNTQKCNLEKINVLISRTLYKQVLNLPVLQIRKQSSNGLNLTCTKSEQVQEASQSIAHSLPFTILTPVTEEQGSYTP